MIIGVLDRMGHQVGHENYRPDVTTTQTLSGFSEGDILRACWTGSEYVFEGTTASCPNQSVPYDTTDPITREFFIGDYGPASAAKYAAHGDVSQGSVRFNRDTEDVILVAMDPTDAILSGGIIQLDPYTGDRGNATVNAIELFEGAGWGKAAGLGEVEMMCKPIPIDHIGDRVFHDMNENGVQDPNEPGIESVVIVMYDVSSPSEGPYTTTTDASGYYSFGGIKYFNDYRLEIDPSQTALTGKNTLTMPLQDSTNSVSPRAVDSDATLNVVDGFAKISLKTQGSGANDDTYDFGWF